jgi:hypothetical protein
MWIYYVLIQNLKCLQCLFEETAAQWIDFIVPEMPLPYLHDPLIDPKKLN